MLSLNKRDPLEGDDDIVKDLGIVSGDLIHVISNCGQSNTTVDPKSISVMASSSDVCDSIVSSGVAKMEAETVSEHCSKETVLNGNGDEAGQMQCDKTVPDVSEVKSSVSVMHTESVDNFADNTQERAAETGQ